MQMTNIKRSMESRGVGDPDKLPNYYYRDDGVKLWEAFESYARGILQLFYKNDEDVKDDHEVGQRGSQQRFPCILAQGSVCW